MFSRYFVLLLALCVVFQIRSSELIPFSVDSNYLTVWNGKEYLPVFIKGTNLGIAKPGTYPGELEASREQYKRWFGEIKDAGFNCIRIYTLHYPHFYEELRNYNLKNPQHPLFLFQGVWLNEEMEGYADDLYLMTDTFRVEIEENIDCVHGRKFIPERQGKASGLYTADVSAWNLGYIIGREIHPAEVLKTNQNNSGDTSFSGSHFSINNASASEVWLTKHLDHVVRYERTHYNTERPVSASSWPTLDPIIHLSEPNRDEDTASVDLSKIKRLDAPAGLFMSYHAYPYYPDFIGNDPAYKTYSDKYGSNSYLGYLLDLKKHYAGFPLIIAEYGVPSSWGVAHYTSSGMNHGGYDEYMQGETNMRLLNTIQSAQLGGGIQFAWIDEWFKRTWVTDAIDFLNRPLWHNITAAEQNFGLKKFVKKEAFIPWQTFDATDEITHVKAFTNYDFFEIELGLKNPMDLLGECWIAFDTYDAALGESVLPNGQILPTRAEFVLHINQHSAMLYVTEAYDLFGLWHRITDDKQKHQSVATDGAPWQIVRWKNNAGDQDVQYIGNLTLNKSFQPKSSKDAVTIYDNKIHVRLPWSLLHVVDPSQKRVFHDDKETREFETQVTDGFALSIHYKNKMYHTNSRFDWEGWNTVTDSDVTDEFKTSYWSMYDQLIKFNTPAVAFPDSFDLSERSYPYSIAASEGVLSNDFDLDGVYMIAVLVDAPNNGFVELNADGSFSYIPANGFKGTDQFTYSIFDGQSLSPGNTVTLNVPQRDEETEPLKDPILFTLFPNPARDVVNVKSDVKISNLRIFDSNSKLIETLSVDSTLYRLNVTKYNRGLYYVVSEIGGKVFALKLLVR